MGLLKNSETSVNKSALKLSSEAFRGSTTSSNDRNKIPAISNATALGDLEKLPGEVRNTIYELVLLSNDGPDNAVYVRENQQVQNQGVRGSTKFSWREPGLLQASASIRKETAAIYYQDNCFHVFARDDEFTTAQLWMKTMTARCAPGKSPVFQLHVSRIRWDNILSLITLAEIVYYLSACENDRDHRDCRSARLLQMCDDKSAAKDPFREPIKERFAEQLWDSLASKVVELSHAARAAGISWDRLKIRVGDAMIKSLNVSDCQYMIVNWAAILDHVKHEFGRD